MGSVWFPSAGYSCLCISGDSFCVSAGWLFAYSFGEAAEGQVEGPRSTSMHPTLLTQLLGKVGEAWLTHAKASNLPEFVVAGCAELVHIWGQL